MADAQRKVSHRTAAPASASQKKPAPAVSGRAGPKGSQRLPSVRTAAASTRKPAPEPEPEVLEEVAQPEVESEPLFDEDDQIEPQKPKPIDNDPSLLSEDSLYSDEDPLEKLREQKKASIKAKPPVAKPSVKTAAVAAPSKGSSVMKAQPAQKGSSIMRAQPAQSAKQAAAAGSNKSVKAAKPAPKAEPEPEPESEVIAEEVPEVIEEVAAHADEAATETAAVEAPSEEAIEEALAEEEAASSKGSNRQKLKATVRLKASSAKTSKKKGAQDDEPTEERMSRRVTKRQSMRSDAPKGISKKHLIIVGIFVLLILVAALGYKPLMKHMNISALDGAESTPAQRKSAVEALYKGWPNDALMLVSSQSRVGSEDAGMRDAALSGLETIAKARQGADTPVNSICTALGAGSTKEAKLAYVKSLSTIAHELRDGKAESDATNLGAIAKAFIASSEATEKDLEVRLVAVDGLGSLVLPGVCVQLIKLATNDQTEVRSRAMQGIAATALPDAAGELLRAMQSEQKDLQDVAKNAFVRVRDSAKSEQLLPLVNDPSPQVRKEIVEALGKRKGDAKAADGIIAAFKDKDPAIRTLAVKSVPVTGVNGNVKTMIPLVTDTSEEVSVATAETLAQLRDPDSCQMILDSFKNNFEGKRLEAYTRALGKRSYGKDLKACETLIKLFSSNPGAEKTIREALVLVTLNGQQGREAVRRGWTADRWQQWFKTINERDAMRAKANEALNELRKQRDSDRKTWPTLFKRVEAEIEHLEKCADMSKNDDAEDVSVISKELKDATLLKEYFMKGSAFDMRN